MQLLGWQGLLRLILSYSHQQAELLAGAFSCTFLTTLSIAMIGNTY